MKNSLVITVVTAILVGALGFFAGLKYQQSQRTPNGNFAFDGQSAQGGSAGARFGRNGNANGFRPVAGQIISADANSLTVKLQDGSSKIIILSNSTRIAKTSSAVKEDLVVGATVSAFGTTNADGSLTAQSVQLNPDFIDRGNNHGGTMPRGQSNSGQNMPFGRSATP